jgi:hypothetical protein
MGGGLAAAIATPGPAAECALAWTVRRRSMLTLMWCSGRRTPTDPIRTRE